ncbi:MAG: RagB/SusD family nutrient uptake outer membrane protein, partial [Parabacteroides gordonii]|nr:RagB/SusD family nutrient uptake outer membrane protein [Parabacteroides gordonii]
MKKILAILFSVSLLTGCNNFIDLEPISQQGSNGFYKSEYEIEQALAAAYNSLQSIEQYGGRGFSSIMEVSSDNTWNTNTTQNGGAYAAFDNFLVDPTNTQLESTWVSCYNGIQKCNIIITRLNAMDGIISAEIKARMLGEAYFLRALTYFNLVRIWGDVPLIVEEVTNVNDAFQHVRESSENVYVQIIKDLEFSGKNLPATYD